jgi:hypothetical protein
MLCLLGCQHSFETSGLSMETQPREAITCYLMDTLLIVSFLLLALYALSSS